MTQRHMRLAISMKMLQPLAFVAAFGVAATGHAPAAMAQQPAGVIRIIVPYSPGTGIDIVARTIGEQLQSRRGQPVVVEQIWRKWHYRCRQRRPRGARRPHARADRRPAFHGEHKFDEAHPL